MEKRMPVIGKAWLKDENEITQWITSKEAEKYRTENWSKGSASDWESGEQINFNELSRKMPGVYDALKHGTEGGSWLKKLLEQDEYNKRMEQCFDLIYLDEKERFVMIRSSEGEWILPARFAKWEVFKNYDDVSVSRLSSISSSGSSLMMASGDVSKTDIKNQIQKKEEEIETARQQLANIQEETEKRLAEFRQQLEEEYRRQNEIIAEKKAELEAKNENIPITDTSWTVKHHFMELAGPPELKEEKITLEAGKFYPDFYPYAKDKLTEENVKKWVIWKNKYYRDDSISYEKRGFTDGYKCYKKVVHDVTYKQSDPHYYISEEKSDCAATWDSSKKMARANMEVFKDEFLNLTYLDSVRIRYAITNRKLGGWKIGRKEVDYAKAIKYLNVALSYVLNREEEKNMLLEHMDVLPENWQVTLTEWRHENSYHKLTPARAKSFVGLLKDKTK